VSAYERERERERERESWERELKSCIDSTSKEREKDFHEFKVKIAINHWAYCDALLGTEMCILAFINYPLFLTTLS
jgi:hypothetical protein